MFGSWVTIAIYIVGCVIVTIPLLEHHVTQNRSNTLLRDLKMEGEGYFV